MIVNNSHKFQNFRQLSNLFSQIWLKKQTASLFSWIGAKSGKKFIRNSQKNAKFDEENEKIGNSIFQNDDDFWLKFWVWRTVQRSALCRSRWELSNEYLLAKFGFDTAENEPCKVCPLSAYRSPRLRCFSWRNRHSEKKIRWEVYRYEMPDFLHKHDRLCFVELLTDFCYNCRRH